MGKQWKQWHILFSWAPKSLQMVTDCRHEVKIHFLLRRKTMTNKKTKLRVGEMFPVCTLEWLTQSESIKINAYFVSIAVICEGLYNFYYQASVGIGHYTRIRVSLLCKLLLSEVEDYSDRQFSNPSIMLFAWLFYVIYLFICLICAQK